MADMSRIHETARAAAGFNSLEDVEAEGDDAPRKPVQAATLNKALVELSNIERDRKALAERERTLKKGFVSEGGSKLALGFIRRLDKMDPDEREALLHEIDAYAAFKSFW